MKGAGGTLVQRLRGMSCGRLLAVALSFEQRLWDRQDLDHVHPEEVSTEINHQMRPAVQHPPNRDDIVIFTSAVGREMDTNIGHPLGPSFLFSHSYRRCCGAVKRPGQPENCQLEPRPRYLLSWQPLLSSQPFGPGAEGG